MRYLRSDMVAWVTDKFACPKIRSEKNPGANGVRFSKEISPV